MNDSDDELRTEVTQLLHAAGVQSTRINHGKIHPNRRRRSLGTILVAAGLLAVTGIAIKLAYENNPADVIATNKNWTAIEVTPVQNISVQDSITQLQLAASNAPHRSSQDGSGSSWHWDASSPDNLTYLNWYTTDGKTTVITQGIATSDLGRDVPPNKEIEEFIRVPVEFDNCDSSASCLISSIADTSSRQGVPIKAAKEFWESLSKLSGSLNFGIATDRLGRPIRAISTSQTGGNTIRLFVDPLNGHILGTEVVSPSGELTTASIIK